MSTFFLIVACVFVIAVLALAGYAIYEMTPLARHKDHYRDEDGKRRFESPRLD
jgi:hypothetical protein